MRFAYALPVHIDVARQAYRRYAGFYDALFGPILQPGRRAVIDALGCRPGERILEVGVGTGLSLPMYPAWVTLTGVDISREMLEKARQRVARRGLSNVEALLEMDAEHMTFADGAFDRVVAMYVVSVVQHPERVMAELRRVCRLGGEILVVNHVRSENPLLGALEKGLAPLSAKLGWHPDFELAKILAAGGTLLEMSSVGLLWKVLRFRNA
jgi:phosphatidylethanolamine/phosphatidyl-N-methylethanolamine N-methyltransferase